MGETIKHRGITSKVRERFERTPGVVLYVKDIAEEFGVPERIVQQTVANIRREGNGQPAVHIPARAWVYQPDGKQVSTARVFEQLAVTKAGDILIQDTEGNVYRATEL